MSLGPLLKLRTALSDFLQHLLSLRLRLAVEPHVVFAAPLGAHAAPNPVLVRQFLRLQRFQGTAITGDNTERGPLSPATGQPSAKTANTLSSPPLDSSRHTSNVCTHSLGGRKDRS